jgi:hypothetical protein
VTRMSKVDEYRKRLRTLEEWDAYLLENSGLPGPRGNLELARAVAWEGDLALFRRYAALDADEAPVNSPHEFLAFCGVLGLGRVLADGNRDVLPALRGHASDSRWRTREATAMAVQWWAEGDMAAALQEMEAWAQGSLLERRAAVAGLCEPKLLHDPDTVSAVLNVLANVTDGIQSESDRRSEEFRVLRKALGYCWSVAVVAQPDLGKPAMERWLESRDPDIRWIMRENLKMKRFPRDPG